MNNIYRGLTKTIWGYVFLHLNVNLGTLNVLPNWVGYLLFFSAIILLGEQLRDLTLLKPFCILLGVGELVDWLTVLFTGGRWWSSFSCWMRCLPASASISTSSSSPTWPSWRRRRGRTEAACGPAAMWTRYCVPSCACPCPGRTGIPWVRSF